MESCALISYPIGSHEQSATHPCCPIYARQHCLRGSGLGRPHRNKHLSKASESLRPSRRANAHLPISVVDVGELGKRGLKKLLIISLRGSKEALVWSYQYAWSDLCGF